MGGCATKPKVLKGDDGEAPSPAPAPPPEPTKEPVSAVPEAKETANFVAVEGEKKVEEDIHATGVAVLAKDFDTVESKEVEVDDDQSNKRQSLSNLFKENEKKGSVETDSIPSEPVKESVEPVEMQKESAEPVKTEPAKESAEPVAVQQESAEPIKTEPVETVKESVEPVAVQQESAEPIKTEPVEPVKVEVIEPVKQESSLETEKPAATSAIADSSVAVNPEIEKSQPEPVTEKVETEKTIEATSAPAVQVTETQNKETSTEDKTEKTEVAK
ncbi:zonadhesin-like protein [Corchorus olitorius]|uniref:Zonadhesin-like protein n=1 Tax=Corchorus olitorius TaxID=93759 RepID=A0A1R3ILW5_9ROSI|nr:zonadhesin-like protein [Corchorus olitorius]